jgi:hypothetical protein
MGKHLLPSHHLTKETLLSAETSLSEKKRWRRLFISQINLLSLSCHLLQRTTAEILQSKPSLLHQRYFTKHSSVTSIAQILSLIILSYPIFLFLFLIKKYTSTLETNQTPAKTAYTPTNRQKQKHQPENC